MRSLMVVLAVVLGGSCDCGGGPPAETDAGTAPSDAGTAPSDAGNADAGDGDAGVDAGFAPDASVGCLMACAATATCQVTSGEPRCVCNAGYSGDGVTCTDVDECQAGTAACATTDSCHNVSGSYFCACGPGQVWNGAACEQAGLRRIGTGTEHTCRIDAQGELRCWGKNRFGQLGDGTLTRRNVMTPVAGGHVWKSVSVYRDTTCALDTGGRVWCWGSVTGVLSATALQINEPQQAGTFADWEQVALGENYVCGLRQGGSLWCWGVNIQGQLGSPTPTFATPEAPLEVEPGTAWAAVSAGVGYTCAVKRDGSLWCWGQNRYGNLGDGTVNTQKTPTQVGTDLDWRLVDTSAFFTTCGIRLDGSLWCWGQNVYGQVGGPTQSVTTPTKRGSESGWRSVDSGSLSTCATRFDGTLSCWGRPIGPDDALLGNGPAGSLGRVKDVAVAEPGAVGRGAPNFACALAEDETTWCWGQNNDGELAQGTFGNKAAPERVGQATWSQVEPGTAYTCGLRTDGTLWCWGGSSAIDRPLSSVGQPGIAQSPVQIDQSTWRTLAAGATVFCGVKGDGSLWCAGSAFSDQLAQVGTDTHWTSVDLGRGFYITTSWMIAAALRDDHSLWTFDDTPRPPVATQFGTDTDWDEVAMARTDACGRRGGGIWCWYKDRPNDPPVQVGTTSDWKLVRSASEYTGLGGQVAAMSYGLRTDGTLWRWTMSSSMPIALTQIGQGIEWQSLDVGPGERCGIASDKSLWCWGTDLPLAISTGVLQSTSDPVRVGTDNDWAQVKVGAAHITALKVDGSLWSWGYGDSGELGHGDAWHLTPVQAR